MKLPGSNLYIKIGLWMILNLLLLAALVAAAAGYTLFGRGYHGILPASFFSNRSDTVLRVISANIQYKSVFQWQELLEPHVNRLPVRFYIQTLDTESIRSADIPDEIINKANKIPRSMYSFCPDPEVMLWDPLGGTLFAGSAENVEYGLPPVPPAIFLRTADPTTYWMGRIMYVPDVNRQIHSVLVAMASDRIDGHGFFFDVTIVFTAVIGSLGISFLWWIPFIRHLSKPLRRMARFAEKVEADNFAALDKQVIQQPEFSGERRDEIGRLGHALLCMTRRVNRMVTGQSQFIRHVAHEMNTPLAKAQMGLGILECRLEGEDRVRVTRVLENLNNLSALTTEVLGYLKARATPGTPQKENVELCSFFTTLVNSEAPDNDIHIEVEPDLHLWTDRSLLQRCIINLLRNAIRYAGDAGPIVIAAAPVPGKTEICISVADCGPGVSEEDLPSLLEPFFRGRAAGTHPGSSGLGLSIVQYSAEICGGRVEYGNRPGRGFIVSLYFPIGEHDKDRLFNFISKDIQHNSTHKATNPEQAPSMRKM